jgi:serine/threonine protein kinase
MTPDHRAINGRYRLVHRLGTGGQGSVWLAEDALLGRPVALKELADRAGSDDLAERRTRAVLEAQALARLNHPSIVSIHDIIFVGDDPWIVMDYIMGRSLDHIIRDRPLEEGALARIGLPLIRGLSAAHSVSILHCDIKPANILIGNDGSVFLLDFGISEIAGEKKTDRPNKIWGTLDFIAPERFSGNPASPSSDLWSLGITFFYALEGYLPFRRQDSMTTMEAILHENVPRLTKQGELARIVSRLLHKDPAQRADVAEVGEVLQVIIGESTTLSKDSRRIFLVHASQDKPAVRNLHSHLIAAGHAPWLDEENIFPGQDWDFEIRKALSQVDCVIVCLSKSATNKIGYIQKEIKRVLDIADEYPDGEIFVLPVRLEDCEVPPQLRKWQYVDIFSPNGFQRILASLRLVRKK